MSEHPIRLRAAWEGSDPEDPSSPPFRVSLPADWRAFPWPSGRPPRRIRLSRRFGRPPGSGPAAPRARFVLDAAHGVRSIAFNGEPLRWREPSPGCLRAELPELAARNEIVVEIELPPAPASAWGEAAIVFGDPPATGGRDD
ncbi:hypothetical protein [Planctomyces sp. SH-PL62]|uniref:hypothetical protein n=1 Tax=Planctomyces sp. SH-PL62 TaxID=1636152 RepID=UPI00078E47C7|nr:hypothetical protein [Planctomyces sp. SH-PL62]AMV36947.1 hypothetical protein VT85_05915 [Planctomyces sp. SH-PL62]